MNKEFEQIMLEVKEFHNLKNKYDEIIQKKSDIINSKLEKIDLKKIIENMEFKKAEETIQELCYIIDDGFKHNTYELRGVLNGKDI